MKKMLFISNVSNKVTNFAIPSIESAQKLGYEVHLAANYSNFNDKPEKYNVTLHHIDFDRNPLSTKNLKAYKQMRCLLKEEKFDFIHCNTPIGGVIGRICGKKMKVRKIIYTAHGFHFYEGAPIINRTVFKGIEKYLAHFTDAIITITKEDFNATKDFSLRNNGKSYYIPGVGIDWERISNVCVNRKNILNEFGILEDNFIIISAGELNSNKNQEVIIRALSELRNPKIHYLICGKGNKEELLKKLISEKKLDSNVHLLGYRTDIIELLKSSDTFVMPSYREGLSRSIMEAMACGLPVVASEIRGNVDLIEDGQNGYLCKSDDILGFADSINKLFINKDLSEKIAKSNLDNSKDYDVKNIKETMMKIYKSVLFN